MQAIIDSILNNEKRVAKLRETPAGNKRYAQIENYIIAECQKQKLKPTHDQLIDLSVKVNRGLRGGDAYA